MHVNRYLHVHVYVTAQVGVDACAMTLQEMTLGSLDMEGQVVGSRKGSGRERREGEETDGEEGWGKRKPSRKL